MSQYTLGIEFGSTRIKAVLIDDQSEVILSVIHEWENSYENDVWTYSLQQIEEGIQDVYQQLAKLYQEKFQTPLTKLRAIGISAMMHGYLALNKTGQLLVPFRTWRNTNTDRASKALSKLFQFNIPHRWSVAHLYEAILNNEPHLAELDKLHTLASYIHYRLCGENVIGIGDAAGMFPIDSKTRTYDEGMLEAFQNLPEVTAKGIDLLSLLPEVLLAGENAGRLSAAGARFLDPSGQLEAGVLLCPPEGDAGTGMVATNAVREKTGNVSVGTSIFSMIVLEHALENYYPEIDMVTTPDGKAVAMVHCNNGTPETDAWIRVFKQCMEYTGQKVTYDEAYAYLYSKALEAKMDCDGIVSVNFLAGEPIAKVEDARPMYTRSVNSTLTLENFMLSQLYSIYATLRMGMDILNAEDVSIEQLIAHGGVFKTEGVMQEVLASSLNTPVAVYDSAGEGGAWGIALLAQFAAKQADGSDDDLASYIQAIFNQLGQAKVVEPKAAMCEGFNTFLENYKSVISKLQ